MASGPHGQYLGACEFILETTYGTTPDPALMQWMGYVQTAKPSQKILTEDIKFLKSVGYTGGRPDSHKIVQTGEEIELEIEYIPQVGNLFASSTTPSLFVGSYGNDAVAPYMPTDSLPSYSIGMVDKWTDASTGGKEYAMYKGCLVKDFTLSVEVGTAARCKATLVGKEAAYTSTATAYYGTSGSHASELSANPIGASQIYEIWMRSTGGTWSRIQEIVNGFEIKISNKIEFAKDLNSSSTSKIAAAVCTSRDITLTLDVDYYDFTKQPSPNKTYFSLDDIVAFQSYDFAIQVESGGTDYYISLCGAKFPELPHAYSLEGIMGEKLTSLSLEGSATNQPIGVADTKAA